MNLNKIPEQLHRLITMVEKWGIGDDGERDSKVYNAQVEELKELVGSLKKEDDLALDEWLSGEEATSKNPSDEHLAYTCYLMAYEYAKVLLKKKDEQHDLPACGIRTALPLKELRVRRDFSNFPERNDMENFQQFLREWTSMVDVELEKELKVVFLNHILKPSQTVVYLFYSLDYQICKGGFLQVVLNRRIDLYYFLFTKENITTIDNFDLWGKILYTAFERAKPIYTELLKTLPNYNRGDFKKYEGQFKDLDDLYFKHKSSFWDSFQNFVIRHKEHFFTG